MEVVIEAAGLTALVVVALFFYTLQSKRDFQKYYAALFSFLLVFVAASFIQVGSLILTVLRLSFLFANGNRIHCVEFCAKTSVR